MCSPSCSLGPYRALHRLYCILFHYTIYGVLTMSLLVRMPEKACSTTRIREVVGPAGPGEGLSRLFLGFVPFEQGERRGFDFGPLDTVAVVMSGSVEAEWEDADGRMKHGIAEGRRDVFDGPPWAICARPRTTLFVKGLSARAELALIRAELIDEEEQEGSAEPPKPGAVIVSPHGLRVSRVRQIASVERSAGPGGRRARRLIVGEVMIPAGAGCDAALYQDGDSTNGADPTCAEPACEGVLHYRFRPQQGAAIQRVRSLSHDYDHTYQVQHGDTVAVPEGFHPEAPVCDCGLYILWARAGADAVSIQLGGCSG